MISSGWPLSCLPKKTCSVLGRLRVSRPNVRHPSLQHAPGRDGDRDGDRDSGRRFPGEAGRCGRRSLRVADPRGDPPPPALARQPPGDEAPRWPLCPAAKRHERRTQWRARRGEPRGRGRRAGVRGGQRCGSGLEGSPLKARRSCKTGPVSPAPVLEDVKFVPKNRRPVAAGNGAAACFYTGGILNTYLKSTSDLLCVRVC